MRILLCGLFLPCLMLLLLLINIAQMLSLALLPIAPGAFRAFNRFCARSWFDALAFVLESVIGVSVIVSGDPLPSKENAFVVANHQSMADIPALVVVASRCRRTGDLKWFVKDVLKWVPGVGWGMLFLDCIFVKRNWNADKDKILSTFEKLRVNKVPFWILSFVEGTRLRPAKLLRSQDFCRKAGLPILHNLMSPRTRGFEATLEGLGALTEAVYDITIAFEPSFPVGEVPGLGALFFGPMKQIHIHARRYPISQIPTSKEARVQWILDRFSEKDRLLMEFRKTGRLG